MNPRTKDQPQQRGRSLQGWNAPDGIETFYEVRSLDSSLAPEEFSRLKRRPVHLVLDNLRSAFNTGSVFRLADAARAAEVVCCGYTAYPPNAKLEQTALGTHRSVPWSHCRDPVAAVRRLRSSGCQVLAVETVAGAEPFHRHCYRFPVALAFGNEALGVSAGVLSECDAVIRIPMAGYKNSVNVAAACAIVLFDCLRQGGWLDAAEDV
jgi:tRNA G18 (ribose-2'-O)-methylase SpoU